MASPQQQKQGDQEGGGGAAGDRRSQYFRVRISDVSSGEWLCALRPWLIGSSPFTQISEAWLGLAPSEGMQDSQGGMA